MVYRINDYFSIYLKKDALAGYHLKRKVGRNEMSHYSATLVSQSFWFREFSQYLDLLTQGLSPEDIRDEALEENAFRMSSPARAKKMIYAVQRRVAVLDVDYYDLFPYLDIVNQKLVNLLAVMFSDTLFDEFMYEVYRKELLLGDGQLHPFEVETFFNQKRLENLQAARWTPQTVRRLASSYLSFLRETNLLVNQGTYDHVNRILIDQRLVTLLRAKEANPELAALIGR